MDPDYLQEGKVLPVCTPGASNFGAHQYSARLTIEYSFSQVSSPDISCGSRCFMDFYLFSDTGFFLIVLKIFGSADLKQMLYP